MSHNTHAYPEGFALVIGGSGGVGTAICRELVESQVPLLLTYNSNQTRAEALVSELHAVSTDVACCQVSLQDLTSLEAALDLGLKAYGRLHSVFIATGYDILNHPYPKSRLSSGSASCAPMRKAPSMRYTRRFPICEPVAVAATCTLVLQAY